MVVTIGGTVDMPSLLLALGLTLRPEHDPDRRGHMAHLAGRLGYASVWLPVRPDRPPPPPADLARLAAQAAPARLGVVIQRSPAALLGALPPEVPVELDPTGADRDALVAAAGGARRWRARVRSRSFDPDAAGLVVSGEDRAAVQADLARGVEARAAVGRTPADLPIAVVLPVSIGRTTREAEARAVRDPALSGRWHPRRAGLFGTLEHAQEQAMALRRSGADEVRAIVADEEDIADLLAQLRAALVGPTPLLHAQGAD
jgi:alkanesulfonate monooxygenase SsuD/methylene tetrahydromethanopterin reductase-like flavin-dependent oxidoreductase (luciferase family)